MTAFTPLSALGGGLMIGGAAALLLLLNGRIAGISGILGGLLPPQAGDAPWRVAFVAGLLLAPVAYAALGHATPAVSLEASTPLLVVSGLLVGFGARLGSGCTSGHGVCGIGRGSRRSLVATAIFMAVAVATVFVSRHVLGA